MCATDITLRNFDLGASPLLTAITCAASRLTALNLELVTGVALHSGDSTHQPGALATLRGLQHLGLRHVECHSFPDVVLQLVDLQSLDARPITSGHPCVWTVPAGITALSRLHRLSLASLAQLVLPPELAKLTSLQSLVLDTGTMPADACVCEKRSAPWWQRVYESCSMMCLVTIVEMGGRTHNTIYF